MIHVNTPHRPLRCGQQHVFHGVISLGKHRFLITGSNKMAAGEGLGVC